MAYLEYRTDENLCEFELTEVDTTIGRADECDLQLLHDPELSRIHCSVQRQADDSFVVVDEGAKNGTFLNGDRVLNEEAPIKDGDVILVGQTEILFHAASSEPPPSQTREALDEIAGEMKQGKGFRTIMREIVRKR